MVTRRAKVSTTLLHEFDICAGVRKKCVLSPGLFCSVPQMAMGQWQDDIKHLGFNFGDGMSHLLALRPSDGGLLWIRAGIWHHVSGFGDIRGTRWSETQHIQNQWFCNTSRSTFNIDNPYNLAIGSFESHKKRTNGLLVFFRRKTLARNNIESTLMYRSHYRFSGSQMDNFVKDARFQNEEWITVRQKMCRSLYVYNVYGFSMQ